MGYELDGYINGYLKEAMNDSRYKRYVRLFNLLNELNLTPKNKNHIDLEDIENEISEILHLEDEETDVKVDKLDIMFRNTIITYVKKFGIYLTQDSTLKELEDFVTGYKNLITIDKSLVEYVLMQLEDDEHEDDTIKLAMILKGHCELDIGTLYDMIEDVREDIYDNLNKYFSGLIDEQGNPINDKAFEIITFFNTLDPNYNNTYIIKDVIANGYRAVNMSVLAPGMYSSIGREFGEVNTIPYEIAATLFLAVDARNDMVTWFKENFNFDILGDQNTESMAAFIKERVENLISKIFEKTLNEGIQL